MIKTILIALTMASPQAWGSVDKMMDCVSYSDDAKAIMAARQKGVNVDKVLSIVEGDKIRTNITVMAYNAPIESTKESAQEVIDGYGDLVMIACLSTD